VSAGVSQARLCLEKYRQQISSTPSTIKIDRKNTLSINFSAAC